MHIESIFTNAMKIAESLKTIWIDGQSNWDVDERV